MAEVTQNIHVSQEDQLKAMSYISEERRAQRFIFPRPQRKEPFCQWKGMGLTGFLSSHAKVFLNEPNKMMNSIQV